MPLVMAEPDIHRAIGQWAENGAGFALAVILQAAGSTPRKVGTKALIAADGSILGTIGGGAVEAEAQRRAIGAIKSGQPLVFDFALAGEQAQSEGPICGGSLRILIDPTVAAHRASYARAAEVTDNGALDIGHWPLGNPANPMPNAQSPRPRLRQAGVLLTAVQVERELTSVDVQWLDGGSILPENEPTGSLAFSQVCKDLLRKRKRGATEFAVPLNAAVRYIISEGKPRLFVELPTPAGESKSFEILIEPVMPPPVLLIAGGGHVGQALARLAAAVGFAVVVLDDRAEFTDPALYPPTVAARCGDIAGQIAEFLSPPPTPLAADTYIAIVTRGHQHDRAALAACVRSSATYIGMIGSRRKVALIRQEMLASGAASEEELARVHAPIGLDIGAETVPEIAASIVAQLIAVRRTGRASVKCRAPNAKSMTNDQ